MIKHLKLFFIVFLVSFAFCDVDPDEHISFEEMVVRHEYPLETHYCITQDGYELKNYRIPGGKGSKPDGKSGKHPVLLGHGLADSSDGFIYNEEHLAPAYVLANAGYDVWLINVRGNKHSNKNVKIDSSNKKFWDFSFHEMGLYDITCVVDMILAATKKKKLVMLVTLKVGQ